MDIFEEAVHKVLNLLIERERSGYNNPLESFDQYKEKKIIQSEESIQEYKNRLINGYHSIIKSVEKHNLYK